MKTAAMRYCRNRWPSSNTSKKNNPSRDCCRQKHWIARMCVPSHSRSPAISTRSTTCAYYATWRARCRSGKRKRTHGTAIGASRDWRRSKSCWPPMQGPEFFATETRRRWPTAASSRRWPTRSAWDAICPPCQPSCAFIRRRVVCPQLKRQRRSGSRKPRRPKKQKKTKKNKHTQTQHPQTNKTQKQNNTNQQKTKKKQTQTNTKKQTGDQH